MGARRRRRVRGPAQRQHLHVRGPPVVRRSLLLLPRRSRRRPQAPPRVHRHLSPHALLLSISLPRRASTPTRVGCRGRPPPRWPRPRLVRLDAADSPPSSPDPDRPSPYATCRTATSSGSSSTLSSPLSGSTTPGSPHTPVSAGLLTPEHSDVLEPAVWGNYSYPTPTTKGDSKDVVAMMDVALVAVDGSGPGVSQW